MDLSDMLGGEHHPSQGQAAELYYSDEGQG
ncbi:hypothetical protein HaLaN_29469 [Haematococcus lacustris]|uniref:Uncharacterized protein n=1 Tax=Haematococcus lacustris TaxID=44745 RepID=A0A6A0AFF3_HAELA|nr:hypothetical protein HaLaN_29469 [Haematococcus lacustris]